MNAKDKAKEIIKKYRPLVKLWDCYFDEPRKEEEIIADTKKCGIIQVDAIIQALEITTGHCELRTLDYHEVQKDFQYWNDVKNEIEKL